MSEYNFESEKNLIGLVYETSQHLRAKAKSIAYGATNSETENYELYDLLQDAVSKLEEIKFELEQELHSDFSSHGIGY